eukprot:scaffold119823_cov33-Cyclotella_meneghiniana.AAC.2
MADADPLPPLPTPTAQTAIKQAVATAHDAPDGTPVDGESPLPPLPLFTRPQSPSAQDNIFDNSDDDARLAEMLLPPSTSSRSRKQIFLMIELMINVWRRCRCHRQPHHLRGSVTV